MLYSSTNVVPEQYTEGPKAPKQACLGQEQIPMLPISPCPAPHPQLHFLELEPPPFCDLLFKYPLPTEAGGTSERQAAWQEQTPLTRQGEPGRFKQHRIQAPICTAAIKELSLALAPLSKGGGSTDTSSTWKGCLS